jgi:putative transposase
LQKQKRKIAAIHEKIYNCRTDDLNKASYRLVNENQVIAVESLNVKGMARNHRLAKAISDASWSRFITMLEYKAFEYGCTVLKVPTFYPSSQTCSCCGYKDPKVKDLSVRRWVCPGCGTIHDRDENAARNILAEALSMQTA